MAANFTNAVEIASEYDEASNALIGNLDRLRDLLSNLEHRLAPALRPGADAAADGAKSAASLQPAQLVASMNHHAARVESMAGDVSSLLHRLCL